MSPESDLPSASLPEHRERVIAALTRHYASDRLDDSELERRIDLAYAAASLAELNALQSDLPALPRPDSAAVSTIGAGEPVRARQTLLAVMGGTERKGTWRPARQIQAVAFWGGLALDFREAQFAPGVTEVTVLALMGGVDIIVPPGLRVECEGLGVMGGFDQLSQEGDLHDPARPTLRVNGLAVMGGIEVTERRPGESAGDRKRRLREERREQRRLGRGGGG
jgi:hypothetical protein